MEMVYIEWAALNSNNTNNKCIILSRLFWINYKLIVLLDTVAAVELTVFSATHDKMDYSRY